MITYPFSVDPKENDFPGNTVTGNENDRQSLVFKNGNSIIEYDLDKIKENFPVVENDNDMARVLIKLFNECIVRTQ